MTRLAEKHKQTNFAFEGHKKNTSAMKKGP